ncbi:hypothetical protein ACIPHM_24245, partial [Pandoraea sp. NPDC087047]
MRRKRLNKNCGYPILTRLASSLLAVGVLLPSPVMAESGDRVINISRNPSLDFKSAPAQAVTHGDIAIGLNANANSGLIGSNPSIAIGHGAKTSVTRSMVLGSSNGGGAVAIGGNSHASAYNSVALGVNSLADRDAISDVANPLAYGAGNNVSTSGGEVSVGGGPVNGDSSNVLRRQITNVAAGTQDSDAVNVSQVKNVKVVVDSNAAATASALGGGASVGADGKITAPAYQVGGRTANNVAEALANVETAVSSAAKGVKINIANKYDAPVAAKEGDIAIGQNAIANSQGPSGSHHALAIGFGAKARAFRAISMGLNSTASALDASSFGWLADANAEGAMAMGAQSVAGAKDAVALGRSSVADRDLITGTANPLAYGAESTVSTKRGAVSIGKVDEERQIVNVAAGTADTDAVNVSQVKGVKGVVDSNAAATASALGGGASVGEDGKITAPAYVVSGATLNNVGEAITQVDNRVSDFDGRLTRQYEGMNERIGQGVIGLVQQEADTRLITVGKDTDGTEVDFAGKNREGSSIDRKLTHVAPGIVSASSVDAINGGQLHATAQSAASALGGGAAVDADGKITAPAYAVAGLPVDNVGEAITRVDTRIDFVDSHVNYVDKLVTDVGGRVTEVDNRLTRHYESINEQVGKSATSLVQQDAETRTLTVAKDTDGTEVSFAGKDAEGNV